MRKNHMVITKTDCPDYPWLFSSTHTWADDQETTSPPYTDQSLIDQFDDDFPDAHDWHEQAEPGRERERERETEVYFYP